MHRSAQSTAVSIERGGPPVRNVQRDLHMQPPGAVIAAAALFIQRLPGQRQRPSYNIGV